MNAASVRLRRLYRPVAAPSARSGIARERAHTCFGRFGRSVPETHHLSIQHICSGTKRRQGGQVLPRYLAAGRWLFCLPDFLSSSSFQTVFGKAAGRVRPEAQPRGAGCNRVARRACPHPCGVGSRLCTAGG